MSEIDHGGPAFPFSTIDNHTEPGMSLRDWYAGMALMGYFAAPHTPHQNSANRETAEYCYGIADEMLKARGQ